VFFKPLSLTMKTKMSVHFLFILGLTFLAACSKETAPNLPINFVNKEGGFYISIDTSSKSFYAYSGEKIKQGRLKGVFYDTIRSSFYLAIISDPFWDSVYHDRDTTVFPAHFNSHSINFETIVDLTNFDPPYHFLLFGLNTCLKPNTHGNPWVIMMVDTKNF
jgi:hypothetical protein